MLIYVSTISWIVFSFGAALGPRDIVRFFEKVLLSYGLTVFIFEPVLIALRFWISVVYARVLRAKRANAVHPRRQSSKREMAVHPTVITERERSQRQVLQVWEHQD